MPENTRETSLLPFFSSSPQSSGKYSVSLLSSMTLCGFSAACTASWASCGMCSSGTSSATASSVSAMAVSMDTAASDTCLWTTACSTFSSWKDSSSCIISSANSSLLTVWSSTTAIISSALPSGSCASSWPRTISAASAAATAVPAAARLHHRTTVLFRAALSRPSDTPFQISAGTSSFASSRIDFTIRSNSFMLLSSNIFPVLYLVLQPDSCPAQLCS